MPALTDVVATGITRFARDLYQWWLATLTEVFPILVNRLAQRRSGAQADITIVSDGVEIVCIRDGQGERYVEQRQLEAFDDEAWAQATQILSNCVSRLILKAPFAQQVSLRLPAQSRSRLRSAIALQLRERSPVPLEHVRWQVCDRSASKGRIDLRIALIKRGTIDRILGLFDERGLSRPDVCASIDGKLVPFRAEHIHADPLGVKPIHLLVLALLFAFPLLASGFLSYFVSLKQEEISSLESAAAPRMRAERLLRARTASAENLSKVLSSKALTPILEALSSRVGDNAYALDASSDPTGRLQVTIETPDPDELNRQLASVPELRSLHAVDQSAADGGFTVKLRSDGNR